MPRLDHTTDTHPSAPLGKQLRVTLHPRLEAFWRELGGIEWLRKRLIELYLDQGCTPRERWLIAAGMASSQSFADAAWTVDNVPDAVVVTNGRVMSRARARKLELEVAPIPAGVTLPASVRMDDRTRGPEVEIADTPLAAQPVRRVAYVPAYVPPPPKPAPPPGSMDEELIERYIRARMYGSSITREVARPSVLLKFWNELPTQAVLPASHEHWSSDPCDRMHADLLFGQRRTLADGRQPEDPED